MKAQQIKNKFTYFDLFAGIGGFKIALDANGGRSLGYSEINEDAITAYCNNFNENPAQNIGDIKAAKDLPRHDLLTAGVPCQSWSIAGRNLGFDDDRGQLWNDTIYLLQKSKPKTFIFENVKGLVDPRNSEAFSYILSRIKMAGYHANFHVINSHEYGVPQNRVRVYIIGFRDVDCYRKFDVPQFENKNMTLADVLGVEVEDSESDEDYVQRDLFGKKIFENKTSLSMKNGFNDYFLFNDIRNGNTTVHTWDIVDTTEREKGICYLLLKNRRKSAYGNLDGNPLSIGHFRSLDPTISEGELDELVEKGILKTVEYSYLVKKHKKKDLTDEENEILGYAKGNEIIVDELKVIRGLKIKRIPISSTLEELKSKNVIECKEVRYEFKYTKISTGLFGIYRIFLPRADIFSTLVASDTNDYVTLRQIYPKNHEDYKREFIEEIYKKGNYRKISKSEACIIQGFPGDFILPDERSKWMKLIGNSVSVPVIDMLCKSIIETGVFEN